MNDVGFNRVQNSRSIFWPQAAEAGFQNPSPLGEGFGPRRGKAVGGPSRGQKPKTILDAAAGGGR